MEDPELRARFLAALDSIAGKFKSDPKCLAAFLLGSVSHDLIWEWSDLQVLLIYDDSYKGPEDYWLMELGVPAAVNIRKRNSFRSYLESADVTDFFFCALSKSTLLFTRDNTLTEYIQDIFYIGDRDREVEMLLGFSQAVYYLNKAEKNFRVKGNRANALFFIPQIAEGIAWLEVARSRAIPERELIAQAKKLQPAVFERIYDPLFNGAVTDKKIDSILLSCHEYLDDNTLEVYRPLISYLHKHGTLKDFSLPTRSHGFGINYQWLYRAGIVDRYADPIRINNRDGFYQVGYRLKEKYRYSLD